MAELISPSGSAEPSPGSVLRWMGSKKRSALQIVSNFPSVGLAGHYFEPFLGGASVFFAYRPRTALLSDSNPALINAWKWIRDCPNELWSRVSSMRVSEAAYYEIRAAEAGELDSFDNAVKFVYLNRYCFNGIYRTNRRDEFNVPFGRKTGSLPDLKSFLDCSDVLKSASLTACDFEQAVQSAVEGDVVYLDPPWQTTRSTYGEYGYSNHGEPSVARIAGVSSELAARGVYVFVSLPKSRQHAFLGSRFIDLEVHYSVASRGASRSTQTEQLICIAPEGALSAVTSA
jgi:DNA adenine methylase